LEKENSSIDGEFLTGMHRSAYTAAESREDVLFLLRWFFSGKPATGAPWKKKASAWDNLDFEGMGG
jgi:hypothetical protein